MNSLIFRSAAPLLSALLLLFSAYICLRGHNEPGGGFIGGLIAATGFAVLGMAKGVDAVLKTLYFHPLSIAGFGLLMAALSGLPSLMGEMPYLTGIWTIIPFIHADMSTIILFDLGVYLVVCGAMTAIALVLENAGEEGDA